MKKELQGIIDSLGWKYEGECPNLDCGNRIFGSILDEDKVTKCPKCGKSVSIFFTPRRFVLSRCLFLHAMRESLRSNEDFRAPFIDAYTALEVFLQEISESQLKKRKVDDEIIKFILEEKRPDIKLYFELFKVLKLQWDKKVNKHIEELRKIQKLRNNVVHRGHFSSEEEVLEAFKKISDIFTDLNEYSIF